MLSENNKRIAKNTIMLYIKMLFIMIISLYSVRMLLNTLGVVDFGIYDVVGGIVTMLGFMSGVMSNASQRFFAFELGRNNIPQLTKIFNTVNLIYIIIAVVILLLAETLGLWFLKEKMTIPADRMDAALWVYQFSILSFIITILNIPYMAMILAYENMKMYAIISVLDVLLKLVIIIPLTTTTHDKLKLYAILIFSVTLFITLTYCFICMRKYEAVRFKLEFDNSSFKTILAYSGWNLFGAITGILNNQGINILLNIFFGPIVNASRAIAYQINYAVNSLSSNLYTAVNPQIIKSYAADDRDRMFLLVFSSSKFAFFLLLLLSIPIFLEIEYILALWLSQVNEYMIVFTRLVILHSLINVWEGPLTQTVRAMGNIRNYQIAVGAVTLLTVPVSYILFKLGYPPESAFVVLIIIYFVATFIRLFILKQLVEFPVKKYIRNVLFVNIIVTLLASIAPVVIYNLMGDSLFRLIILFMSSLVSVAFFVYCIGLNKNEKQKMLLYLKKYRPLSK